MRRDPQKRPKALPKVRNGVLLFVPKRGTRKPSLELVNRLRDGILK